MIDSFDNGNWKEFFVSWNQIIPEVFRKDDIETLKYEFYIRLYFALFHLQLSIEDQMHIAKAWEEMDQFKKYLESKGTILSGNQELLKFFALPYVDNPMSHE